MPTQDLLDAHGDQYRSYVVRLRRSDEHQAWRISVEAVSTRQQQNLKDVTALAEFFAAQMAGAAGQPAELD